MTTVKTKFRPSTVEGKEGTLYFQVTHNRVVRQMGTGYRLYPHEWANGAVAIATGTSLERQRYLQGVCDRLRADMARLGGIVRSFERKGGPYTSEQVTDAFRSPGEGEGWLRVFAGKLAAHSRETGHARQAETYTTSVSSFLRFRAEKGDVRLADIDGEMMEEYEAWLKCDGKCPNTISFYMRNLRAIYNRAVDKELTDDCRPFRRVYTGVDKTTKRAVPAESIRRIRELDFAPHSPQAKARDLFLISFFLCGISFVDLAFLKKTDLKNGVLTYRRRKTGQMITVKWKPEMQGIVDRYGDSTSPYLLPIIVAPGEDERKQYRNGIHMTNKYLKDIGELAGCPVKLTSYCSRHAWASIAKNGGVSVSVISEMLGHDSEKTTRIYLDSFDVARMDEANNIVLRSVV